MGRLIMNRFCRSRSRVPTSLSRRIIPVRYLAHICATLLVILGVLGALDGKAGATGSTATDKIKPSSLKIFCEPGESTCSGVGVSIESAVKTVKITNTSSSVSLQFQGLSIGGTNYGDFTLYDDTCYNATVAPGAGCSFGVYVTPQAAGTRTAYVNIPDNTPDSPQLVALSAVGINATDKIKPTSLKNFCEPGESTCSGVGVSIGSAGQTVTITNNSSVSLQFQGLSIGGTNYGDFTLYDDTCYNAKVAPGAGCSFGVYVTPQAAGTRTAYVNIPDSTALGVQRVPLSAVGINATDQISPTNLSGFCEPGESTCSGVGVSIGSAGQTVTITNNSSVSLQFQGLSIGGTNYGDFTLYDDTCYNAKVAPGAGCSFGVYVTPQAAGTRTAYVNIPDSTALGVQRVPLSAVGINATDQISPTNLSGFCEPGESTCSGVGVSIGSAGQTVTITNNSSVSLQFQGLSIGGTNYGDFTLYDDTCYNAKVAPGAGCSFGVYVTPQAAGTRTAYVNIPDSTALGVQRVPLSAVGINATDQISPASVNFGTQSVGVTSPGQTVTITNTSSVSLQFQGLSIGGTNYGDFTLYDDTCYNAKVAPGAGCTFGLTFDPQAAGARDAYVSVPDSTATGIQTVPIAGTGGSGGVPAPTIGQVNPDQATAGEVVNVTGTNFTTTGTTSFTFGSMAGTNVTCVSSESCVATVPVGSGTVSVIATVAGVSSSSNPTFTYVTPTITGITPGSGPTDGGMPVTVIGTNLADVNTIDFGSTPVGAGNCSATSCVVDLPSHTAASTSIQAMTSSGVSSTGSVQFLYASPNITITPSSGTTFSSVIDTADDATFTVTDSGTSDILLAEDGFTGSGSGEFGNDGDQCNSALLGPQQSCTIVVEFYDPNVNTEAATLEIFDSAQKQVASAQLSGTATAPKITSITMVPDEQDPELVISGAGFGDGLPNADLGESVQTNYFTLTDESENPQWSAGNIGGNCDATISEWSNTTIVVTPTIGGLLSPCGLQVGDSLLVSVSNIQDTTWTAAPETTTVIGTSGLVQPTVSSLSQIYGYQGGGGSLTIYGSGFSAGVASVEFGPYATTDVTVNSDSILTVNSVPAAATAQGVSVIVTSSSGISSATCLLQGIYWFACGNSYFYLAEQSFAFSASGGFNASVDVDSSDESGDGSTETSTGDEEQSESSDGQACLGDPSASGTFTVSVSGSAQATLSGQVGTSSNDGIPSAVVGNGTIDVSSAAFTVGLSGSTDGEVDIPILGVPCGLALYLRVAGSIDLSTSVGIQLTDLAFTLPNTGFVNGQLIGLVGSPPVAPTITCGGVPLTSENMGSCIMVTTTFAVQGSVTVSIWAQAGPDEANLGIGPEITLVGTYSGNQFSSGECFDVRAQAHVGIDLPSPLPSIDLGPSVELVGPYTLAGSGC